MKQHSSTIDLDAYRDRQVTEEWLRRYGHELNHHHQTRCPFPEHTDNTPSFTVYPDGHWHCFGGCGTGDLVALIGRLLYGQGYQGQGGQFREVLAMLGGCDIPALSPAEQAQRRAQSQAQQALDASRIQAIREELCNTAQNAHNRLLRRFDYHRGVLQGWGIPEPLAAGQRLGWDGQRYTFPATFTVPGARRAITFGVKKRVAPDSPAKPKYIMEKGSRPGLYNGDIIHTAPPAIVVTEGERDCLALLSQGVPAISTTGGAGFWRSQKAEWWAQWLIGVPTLIFWRDYDELSQSHPSPQDNPGLQCALDFRSRFPRAIIIESPGYKDAADYIADGQDWRDVIKPEWIQGRV